MIIHRPAFRITAFVLTAASLTSCVKLEVDQAFKDPADPSTVTVDARPMKDSFIYALPETAITINGTITLNDCDGIVVPTVDPTEPVPIDLTENFTVSSSVLADPTQQYSINYSKLQNWTKQLNLSVGTYPNKALQNINGTITDQAGPIFLAAVQAAIGIGVAGSIPGVAALPNRVTSEDLLADRKFMSDLPPDKRNLLKSPELARRSEPLDFFAEKLSLNTKLRAALVRIARTRFTKIVSAVVPGKVVYCSARVEEGLGRIRKINDQIKELLEKTVKTGDNGNVSYAPSPNDPILLRDQAEINALDSEYGFVRSFTMTWVPTRHDLHYSPGDKLVLLNKNVDLFAKIISPAWLTPAGTLSIQTSSNAIAVKVQKPLALALEIQPWTIGRDFIDKPLVGGEPLAKVEPTPDGVLIRDPAVAVLRTCLGSCGGKLTAVSDISKIPPVAPDDDVQNIAMDTTADTIETDVTTDVATVLPVPLPQLGRFEVMPLKNELFETSAVSATLNSDSSIATVGNQESNSVATAGFGAVTTAAGTVASGIAARNTAVSSQNTAITNAATFADTVNKALADCLVQQAAIIKSGGKPIGSCQ